MNQLKKTPLHAAYSGMDGVKLIDFGGWELPVQFAAGIIAEHRTVRENAGIFDVSHMGEIFVSGKGSAAYLDTLVCGSVQTMRTGRCLYTILCNPAGGAVDDLVIYRIGDENFMLVVNAANTEKDFLWVSSKNPEAENRADTVQIQNRSENWVQIALQGPESEVYLQELADVNLGDIPFYGFMENISLAGVQALVSRTGYTGEAGFEIYCEPADGPGLWTTLLNSTRDRGVLPCGLGSRDTLRMEARLPLYGHELSEGSGPLEAGLKSFIDFDKSRFIGKDALKRLNDSGEYGILRGIIMTDRGVPRQGYPVFVSGKKAGRVTSGGKSPSLDDFIAIARLSRGLVKTGDPVEIEINGKLRAGEIVATPFYAKAYTK